MTTTPISPAPVIHRSPNAGHRRNGQKPDIVLLHYTGMETAQAALDRLCSEQAQVSSHYLIDEDGTLYSLVPEDLRAWHAGLSCWEGDRDVNSRSIGIELVNPGHEFGYRPFPDTQIDRLLSLAKDIIDRYRIRPWHVLGHSDVAPKRKSDPGELFPWKTLAQHGIGLWPEPLKKPSFPAPLPGDTGQTVQRLQRLLLGFGYDITVSAVYDDDTTDIVRAFQRHFAPHTIDGVANDKLIAILERLHDTKYACTPVPDQNCGFISDM